MSRFRPIALVVVALLLVLVMPGTAAAAETVDVTGTVTAPDGSPATGIEVLVMVQGSDMVIPATTDETGAFAAQLEAAIGDTLEIRATGETVADAPDAQGCVHSATPTGSASVVIEALPLDPVLVALDKVLEGTVCAATATPHPPRDVTPPATDLAGDGGSREGGSGTTIVVAGLALLSLVSLVITRRRPARRVRVRR